VLRAPIGLKTASVRCVVRRPFVYITSCKRQRQATADITDNSVDMEDLENGVLNAKRRSLACKSPTRLCATWDLKADE